MKEIQHNKFSLIQIERKVHISSSYIGEFNSTMIERCFVLLETFNNLEDAQLAQKENKNKSLIISSW